MTRPKRAVKRLERRVAAVSDQLKAGADALREAAARERATSEILRAISSAHTDAQPVFDAIARSARRLCAARTGIVHRFDGTNSSLVALAGG